jgi:cell division GTPase FtsZ
MKPSDRSLDIAVIGLGQGGGNIAAEFARRGYRAMALNTARTDLSALGAANHPTLSEAQRLYIGIDGYDGAGADLNYGRQCVLESSERIREVVARHTEGADVVLLTAGLGGGTGSALSELVRALESLELPLTALATLPGDQESGIAKVNAVRAVSELVKIPDLGLIFADNSRLAELHGNVTLDEYFERINEIIVDPLDAFNRLNQRPGLHPIRTLDGEDLRTLLMSTGVLNYAEGHLQGLSVEGVTEWVSNSLSNSSVMPSGFAMADIAYLGLVVEASGDLLATTPFTFFNEVSERIKNGTSGAGIYMGVYSNDQTPAHTATLRMLASTPTLPKGIQTIVSAAQREGSALREKLSRSVVNLELGDIADFDLLPARSASNAPAGITKGRRSARPGRRQQVSNTRNQLDAAVFEPPAARAAEPSQERAPNPFAQRAAEPVAPRAPDPFAQHTPEPPVARISELAPQRASDFAERTPEPPPQRYSGEPVFGRGASEPAPQRYAGEPVFGRGASEPAPQRSEPVARPNPLSEAVVRPLHSEPASRAAADATARPSFRAPQASTVRGVSAPAPALNGVDEVDPTTDVGDRSEPETYDRLVDAFLNTESESIRRRIATRLHSSRNSDHPLARFYANRAIERLVDAGEERALESVMSQIGAE